jgi:hypothetical protein
MFGIKEISVQDARTSSTTKQERLGTQARTADGREYVYVKAGASDLAPGKLVVAKDEVANHKNIAVAAAAAVGDTRVQVTLGATAAAEDLYADGFLTVNDAAGEGISYRIASHGAIDSAGTGWINLDEPVKVALTTSSQVSLHSVYESVIISATDQANFALGVPNVTIGDTEFGWLQTRGHCSVLADEGSAIGTSLTIGTAVAGAVEAVDAAAEQIVGRQIYLAVDTEYQPVFLELS